MNYRVVALDLDGTLLDSQLQIRQESFAALEEIRRRGLDVILVTGRHHAAAAPYHRHLGLTSPIICCNGTYLYDYRRREATMTNPLSRPQALFLLRKIREHRVHALMYTTDDIVYEHVEPHLGRLLVWEKTLPTNEREIFRQVSRFEDVAVISPIVWKFALTHPVPEPLLALVREAEHDMGLACEWSGDRRVDIAQGGNSKGALLARWLAERQISPGQVIAFGDSPNDISMLQLAGIGIAMAGCLTSVREAADIQAGHNDSDTIARMLERILGGKF